MTLSTQEMKKGHTYLQWTLAFLANVAALSAGFESGWISPTAKLLKSESSPTGSALSSSNLAWIAGSMNMAAVLGVLIFAYIADRYGRKRAIMCISLPQIIAWTIKITYPTAYTLVIARIMGGSAVGASYIVVSMYVKEISEDRIRGTLGTLLSLTHSSGVLIMYTLGGYLDYYTVGYCVIGLPLLQIILMLRAPETPSFLVKQGQYNEALETVALLRGLDKDDVRVQNEVENMKKTDEHYKSMPQISILTILKDKPWRRGIILIALCFTFQGFNGSLALVTYALPILVSTGVEFEIDPKLQTLSLPCIMILSGLSLSMLVDRFGRKWLLTGALAISTFSMFTMGAAILVQQNGGSVPNWLPVFVMTLSVAVYGGGVSPLPYIILSEMFSFQIRAKVMGGIVAYAWFTTCITIFTYPLLTTYFRSYVPFFIYGTVNLLGSVIVALFLCETKGKTDEEIRQLLSRGNKKSKQTNC